MRLCLKHLAVVAVVVMPIFFLLEYWLMVGLKGEAQLPVVLKSGACESLLFVIPPSTVSYCVHGALSQRGKQQ